MHECAAGASNGTAEISPELTGYTATWAQFKTIYRHIYLPNPTKYAGQAAGAASLNR